jgi:hypothetical protein
MIAILSRIIESMEESKRCLDNLQGASTKIHDNKNLPLLHQTRQDLRFYWTDVGDFMQTECIQTANKVVGLQDAKAPSQLLVALGELKAEAEKCSLRARALVDRHDEFIRSFTARNIRFRGSDAIIANFKRACGQLRAGLIDLRALIDQQCQACATYQKTVQTNYKPAMLGEFTSLGKQWRPYEAKLLETYVQIRTLSDDIEPGGKHSKDIKPDGKHSKDIKSGGKPSKDTKSGGKPSKDVKSGGKPPKDVKSGGKPPNDIKSGGKPSNDIKSGGQKSNDIKSGGKKSNDIKSGGKQPVRSKNSSGGTCCIIM